MTDLKPCPFCNRPVSISVYGPLATISCVCCNLEMSEPIEHIGDVSTAPHHLSMRWNQRPIEDARTALEPIHASDCALHNGPALPAGPCDCGAMASAAMKGQSHD